MSIWTILWLLWGAGFAGIEGAALANDKPGDTLSEHLRKWFRVDTKPGRTLWLVVSSIWGVAFALHIANGGWF